MAGPFGPVGRGPNGTCHPEDHVVVCMGLFTAEERDDIVAAGYTFVYAFVAAEPEVLLVPRAQRATERVTRTLAE